MAKVYSAPAEITVPVPTCSNYNFEVEMLKEKAYVKELREWLRARCPSPLVGEEVSCHVADGYARYLIASEKPFTLVHLTLGDAYSAGPIWERGLRLADARKMIENAKWLHEQFAGRKLSEV